MKPNEAFAKLVSDEDVNMAADALLSNGMKAFVVSNGEEAKKKVLELIPADAEVFTMTSMTLEATGIDKEINESGKYNALRLKHYAIERIYEYSYPLEDERAQKAYGIHSGVNKILIINKEIIPERTTVILVKEKLGF